MADYSWDNPINVKDFASGIPRLNHVLKVLVNADFH